MRQQFPGRRVARATAISNSEGATNSGNQTPRLGEKTLLKGPPFISFVGSLLAFLGREKALLRAKLDKPDYSSFCFWNPDPSIW